MRKIWTTLAVAGLMLAGCGKTETAVETAPEPTAAAPPTETAPSGEAASTMPHDMGDMSGMDHSSADMSGMNHESGEMGHGEVAPDGVDKADVCPIQHDKIAGKTAYADYNGKRYYFCCNGCTKKFLEHPDQVIADNPEWAAKWSEDTPS